MSGFIEQTLIEILKYGHENAWPSMVGCVQSEATMRYDAGIYPPRNLWVFKINKKVRLRDGCYFGFQYVIVAKSPVVTGPVLAKL